MSAEPNMPDYAAMSGPEMLMALGDDGAAWAAAFCQIAKTRGHDIDEGWMGSWFANAIENSWDVRTRREIGERGVRFVGIDWGKPGSGMTACICPQCQTMHTWEARTEPQECPTCGFLFNFTGLRVVK